MTLEYKCRDCGEVFNEHQAAFVSAGYDCHYIGDGRYLEEVGEDACPACLSTAFDDKDEDQDEDNT
jgi:rubredoxin